MESNFSIRKTEDVQVFLNCAALMVHSDPWVTLGIPYEHCVKAFEGEYKEINILEVEGKLAGFVIMQTQGTFKGYIQTICIDKDYRGQGYGKKLLLHCESRILSYSPNIFICVSSFNSGAIKLYEEIGYKRVGELENFLKTGYSELLFRKTVGPVIGYRGQSNNDSGRQR